MIWKGDVSTMSIRSKHESAPDPETVRYWDYLPEYRRHRAEILRITDEVFSSGRVILGSRVESFERNFAAFCETAFGVGVNSCTDALFLALKALNVGVGDE